MKKVHGYELLKKGGNWLAAARSFLQRNVPRGGSLTWGSEDTVTLSVRQIEEMAAEVAATVINDQAT